MCTCKWRQLWSLLQKFRDCITTCVHANGGGCGLYFRSLGTVLLHVYMQMEEAVVVLQKFGDCITTCVHANGGSCGPYFRSSGTVLLHVYMQMEVTVVATSEVQGLYYCMCTCKWRQLWSLLQKFRDCITACGHANGGSCGRLLQKFRDCITACVHANGGSCGRYFRNSGTVLLHVYMQMEVAVVATSEVQGLYYCMCTCKWRQLWSQLQKFRDCITACVHANEGSCGLYFRSSGTVLLHVYMQMEVAVVYTSEVKGLYYCMCTCKCRQPVVATSEVQGLYYCMCTCKWRQLWSLLQKFRDCITACVHANGGSCGRYFRSSGTVLLHVYMQMEVAVVSTSEVQGLYYCMCTCKWRQLWSQLQKFRDCITACVHANVGSCGRYFRSSGTVLLHVYMQMEVAVVATSEVQGLYYCMCTWKWRQLWSLLQKFRDCITACVHANGGSCGLYLRSLGTVLLHVYMQMEEAVVVLQKFGDCITACVHANGGSCGPYFRSSGTVLLHVYIQMEVAVVATSEVQGLYYCMCTCKWRQLWSLLQKFRDCITASGPANGVSCGRYFRSSGTVLLYVYMQMEVAVVSTSKVQGLYYCMCTCKWRELWSLHQKFRDSITACVPANGGSSGRYFRSSGTVLLHVYMQMEVAVFATSEVQGLYYCMCTCKLRQLWSLLQKFRDCITACVHANGGGCGRYFRSSGTVLLHVYMQMEVALVSTSEVRNYITACVHANGGSCGRYFRNSGTVLLHVYMQMEVIVVATSEVQGLYYCMCTCK